MDARILCGLVLLAGCGSDPVASEPASWTASRGATAAPLLTVSPVVTLVQLDRPAYAITLDHDDVFFTTSFTTSLEVQQPIIMRCSKQGCETATTIALGRAMPTRVVVDAVNLYWLSANETSTSKSILSCPLAGCGDATPTVVTFADPILDLASNGASIFWLGDGVVTACNGSSCDDTMHVVVANVDAIQIAPTSSALYFHDFDESIIGCALDHCATTERRVATDFGFTPIALDATNVYFRTPAGITRCAQTGCREPSVIAPLDKDANVIDVVADGVHVYWINHQSVFACPVTGCAKPIVIAAGGDGLKSANRLAIDDQYLYWTAGDAFAGTLSENQEQSPKPGAIFRIAK